MESLEISKFWRTFLDAGFQESLAIISYIRRAQSQNSNGRLRVVPHFSQGSTGRAREVIAIKCFVSHVLFSNVMYVDHPTDRPKSKKWWFIGEDI